jgi:hypothetical protein
MKSSVFTLLTTNLASSSAFLETKNFEDSEFIPSSTSLLGLSHSSHNFGKHHCSKSKHIPEEAIKKLFEPAQPSRNSGVTMLPKNSKKSQR